MTIRRILIVEDEVLIAISLEAALSDGGLMPVGPFSRLDQAVSAAETEALDGAVLDVNLGGAKVFPVADALIARGIPFLFLTGYANSQLPPKYRGTITLAKPFQERQIVDRVVTLLDQRAEA